jgi:hypothetical protein
MCQNLVYNTSNYIFNIKLEHKVYLKQGTYVYMCHCVCINMGMLRYM